MKPLRIFTAFEVDHLGWFHWRVALIQRVTAEGYEPVVSEWGAWEAYTRDGAFRQATEAVKRLNREEHPEMYPQKQGSHETIPIPP